MPVAPHQLVDRLDHLLGDADRAITNFFALGHFFASKAAATAKSARLENDTSPPVHQVDNTNAA